MLQPFSCSQTLSLANWLLKNYLRVEFGWKESHLSCSYLSLSAFLYSLRLVVLQFIFLLPLQFLYFLEVASGFSLGSAVLTYSSWDPLPSHGTFPSLHHPWPTVIKGKLQLMFCKHHLWWVCCSIPWVCGICFKLFVCFFF